MSEYGSDYDDDAFEELDKEKDEDMSEEKILDNDEEIDKQFEDPLEEYNNFNPKEEVEDPFEEYNNFDPQEEVEDSLEEHRNLFLDNLNEGSKEELPISDVLDENSHETKPEINKEAIMQEIINGDISEIQDFKENLRDNIYKNTRLDLNEKSKIIKKLQNDCRTEEEKNELKLILSKFTIGELEEYRNKNIEKNTIIDEESNEESDDLLDSKEYFDDENVNKGLLEDALNKSEDHNIDNEYIDEIIDKQEDSDIKKEFFEVPNDKLNDHEVDKEFKEQLDKDKEERKKDSNNIENLNEFRLNQEDLQEKSQEYAELIHDYNKILDEGIQDAFRQYYDETGKYANYGRNLKKDFIEWVENKGFNTAIINNLNDIQNNQEITNFLNDKIRNSDLSQNEIVDKLNETGLSISRKTVGNYALNEVFNGIKVEYNKRFDKSLDPAIKEIIINRLNKEVEKFTSGVQHDSLFKIAKDFSEVSKTMIDKIAKNEVSQDIYENMWPSTSGTVDSETKQNIRKVIEREVQEGNPRSLRNISEDFPDVSTTTISELAKEMYPEEYKELWPTIEKIPEAIKDEIIKTIKDEAQKENPRTLRDIHRDFPEVGADSIKRIAKQIIPKDLHNKTWPPLTTEIPKEIALKITQTLKDEIKKSKPRSLNELGRFFDVSTDYVAQLAKKTISKQVYEDTWRPHEPITDATKNAIIEDVVNTKLNISEIAEKNCVSPPSVSNISQRDGFQDNIDAHRERFPIDENLEIGTYSHLNLNSLLTRAFNNISKQKYYAEPNIYSDNRRPDGLILEDNNFLHQRITNPQTGDYLRNKLELDPKNIDYIKSTQFDFTNDVSNENLLNKIEKYQSEDNFLVIVGTRWYLYDDINHLPVDDRIKYPENVRVICHSLGADLIGLKGEDKNLYDKIIDFNYNHDLDSLKTLYNYDLSSINSHNTEELKQDLIQKGYIKEDFNEYFNFEVLNKKDMNRKQLDLDYFLNG